MTSGGHYKDHFFCSLRSQAQVFRIKSNGAEKLVFSDLQVQSFCGKAGSIITFVDINGRERTANDVLCKNKPGPVHVSVTDSTEVILAYPVSR